MRTVSTPRAIALALIAAALISALAWQPAQAEEIVHVVQPGENLFRIGLNYGVSWTAIMRANGLASTYIHVGQQLTIPSLDSVATAPAPAPANESPSPPTTSAAAAGPAASIRYVIQRGDTLFSIALRFGVTAGQLAAANNISNPSLIYVGQTLTIPGPSAASSPPPAAAAQAPAVGAKQIVVDISEQHLYAYEGESLIYSFVASTGEPGRDTRPGSYSVLNKIPNAYGATWNIWMPNWLGIYWAGRLQNGIHALPILANGLRLWDGWLGTPVSYGCVILGSDEALYLYSWADVGTPVSIRY